MSRPSAPHPCTEARVGSAHGSPKSLPHKAKVVQRCLTKRPAVKL